MVETGNKHRILSLLVNGYLEDRKGDVRVTLRYILPIFFGRCPFSEVCLICTTFRELQT